MEIQKEEIQRILEVYKPENRWLKEAKLEYPVCYGTFQITPRTYTIEPLSHMTDVEAQLCLNQLAYTLLACSLKNNLINAGLSYEDFFKLQREGMFIVKSKKNFKRQIRTDKEVKGQIEIIRYKKLRDMIIAMSKFNFEDNACFGELELVVKALCLSA